MNFLILLDTFENNTIHFGDEFFSQFAVFADSNHFSLASVLF